MIGFQAICHGSLTITPKSSRQKKPSPQSLLSAIMKKTNITDETRWACRTFYSYLQNRITETPLSIYPIPTLNTLPTALMYPLDGKGILLFTSSTSNLGKSFEITMDEVNDGYHVSGFIECVIQEITLDQLSGLTIMILPKWKQTRIRRLVPRLLFSEPRL